MAHQPDPDKARYHVSSLGIKYLLPLCQSVVDVVKEHNSIRSTIYDPQTFAHSFDTKQWVRGNVDVSGHLTFEFLFT